VERLVIEHGEELFGRLLERQLVFLVRQFDPLPGVAIG